jgi:hypothetical protein
MWERTRQAARKTPAVADFSTGQLTLFAPGLTHGLERGPDTHLGKPALVGGRLGDLQEPVDLMPALSPNANEFGFFGGRQDNPLRRDAGPQDLDLRLEQPQLRVVTRHEELVQEDDKEG